MVTPMNEQWEYFPFQAEESVGTVVYNHELSASINELPIHQSVRFKLKFKSPNAEGLPDAAESKTAELLETKIESELAERSGVYTGRVTFEGRRLFYSYVDSDEKSIATLVTSLGNEFDCNLEYDVRDDPEKEDYWRDLFPSPETWQYIQNSKVVRALKEAGDGLNSPRRIDHWASFTAKSQAKLFAKSVKTDGFQFDSVPDSKSEQGTYDIQFYRDDVPELSSITALTIQLASQASELNGTYGGWEAFVVRET